MFVLVTGMFKEGWIDMKRHKQDKETNNKKCLLFDRESGQFKEVFWSDLRVGQIVRVNDKKQVPADLIILATSDKEGLGYCSTATLDGEQTLKPK